jgi:hypothetical protein
MNEEGVPVGGGLPPTSMAEDVVKWQVLSVGALFAVVGEELRLWVPCCRSLCAAQRP